MRIFKRTNLARYFSVLTLIATLAGALTFAKPAHAMDTCSGTSSASNNPTNSVWHATWFGSPNNLYVDQYQYLLYVTNNSGHTCHIYFVMDIPSTSGGWYIDDYYNWQTSKGHQPYIAATQAARTCVWNDVGHRSATCDMYVANTGAAGITMHWVHASPYSNQHDTADLYIWSHDDSDGSDYLLLHNSSFDVY